MQYKPLKKKDILEGLKDTIFSNIQIFDTVESTNDIARDMAAKGAKEGTLIIAEEQSSGKGRMGRKWFSKKYANLLFSIILKPEIEKEQIFSLNMAIALAFVEAIKQLFYINAMIKWPNDLYIKNKKLAGILTEFSLKGKHVEYVIIGMGINVNWSPDNSELLYPAISLNEERGEYIDRQLLLINGLIKFDKYYKQIYEGNIDRLYEKWNKNCMIIGKEVTILDHDKNDQINGIAVKIDKDGTLILKINGREKKIFYGDVSLR